MQGSPVGIADLEVVEIECQRDILFQHSQFFAQEGHVPLRLKLLPHLIRADFVNVVVNVFQFSIAFDQFGRRDLADPLYPGDIV